MGGVKPPLSQAVIAGSNNFGTQYWYTSCSFRQKQDCKGWGSIQTLWRRSLLPKYHTVSRYTHKCNFIYTRKKSTAFCVIFTKFTKLSTVFCYHILYRISPKSDNKCEKSRYKLMYAPKNAMYFTSPDFHGTHQNSTNFLTYYVRNFIQLERKNVKNTDKIFCTFLSMLITEPTFTKHTCAKTQYWISPKSVTKCGKCG